MVKLISLIMILLTCHLLSAQITYLRYSYAGDESYGILENGTVYELSGNIFESPNRTGKTVSLSEVEVLIPCNPSKVLAVGLNYRSHIGDREPSVYPGLFSKFPTSLTAHNMPIVIPGDATNLHYEGELVIVIGKETRRISKEKASDYIFGVTIGNDISERDWQRSDLQWIRAKATDTFGPVGPYIVTGLNYNNLLLETRLNGETVQSEYTRDLIHDVETIVSYISQYITLLPGDLIFTGTPDATRPMKPGDTVQVEIEGIGILKNRVEKNE